MKYLVTGFALLMMNNLIAMKTTENRVSFLRSQSCQIINNQEVAPSPLIPTSLSCTLNDQTYNAETMELSSYNLLDFMQAHQTKFARRLICFDNVLIYTIYSYICLYLLKNYDEQNCPTSRINILNMIYLNRERAKNECSLSCRNFVDYLDFLYNTRLTEIINEKNAKEEYGKIFQSWTEKILFLLNNPPRSPSKKLFEQAKCLFYRIQPLS